MRRRDALALALCATAFPAAADEPVRRGRALQFPRDHGAHLGAAIEWWYITGELHAAGDAHYGFQITFFRSRTGLATQLDSRFAARHLLFAHAALTDLGAGQHLHAQRIARWSGDPDAALARAALHDTDLRVGGWTLHRRDVEGRSLYTTQFGSNGSAAQAFELQLALRVTQPSLLQGDAGFSRKGPLERHASHYYSEPQLATQATLSVDGRRVQAQGRAWLDHEWSDEILAEGAVGWDWIGFNGFDGSALTAFRLRRADGSTLWAGGSHRAAGAPVVAFAPESVNWTPQRRWRSPATGAEYPVQWQLQTPAGRHTVKALLDAQELDSRQGTGTLYWEGLSELLDDGGRRVGLGYLEMTGYAGVLRL